MASGTANSHPAEASVAAQVLFLRTVLRGTRQERTMKVICFVEHPRRNAER